MPRNSTHHFGRQQPDQLFDSTLDVIYVLLVALSTDVVVHSGEGDTRKPR